MDIKSIINKIDCFSTAIEALEVLILEHDQNILKPILIHLKFEKKVATINLSTAKMDIEVQHEQIIRRSNI